MKKAFTVVEITTVFLLILLVASFTIPLVLNDSRKANEIIKWRHSYEDIIFSFQSLWAQMTKEDEIEMVKTLKSLKTPKEKEDILIKEFEPFLRVTSKFEDEKYKIKYLNSEKVEEKQFYHFDNFYKTKNDTIIGIKWLGELYDKAPFVLLMIDLNGEESPNMWGKDVFGINVYRNHLEPFGQNIPAREIEADCSRKGRGVYCSYDYLTGAQF